jgi:hypothetical protein
MENNLIGYKVLAINQCRDKVEVTILDMYLQTSAMCHSSYHECIGIDDDNNVHTFSPNAIIKIIKFTYETDI